MGGHSAKSFRITPAPIIPVTPDYIVTGELEPDATGEYFEDGLYNGQMSYAREDSSWFIYFFENTWIISKAKGSQPDYVWWLRSSPEIAGTYSAEEDATGEATVTGP